MSPLGVKQIALQEHYRLGYFKMLPQNIVLVLLGHLDKTMYLVKVPFEVFLDDTVFRVKNLFWEMCSVLNH